MYTIPYVIFFSEYIQPICLPGNVNFSDDTMLTVAGWGTTAEGIR